MKAVIKYPGSKWRIADWIISFFPEHHSYLEPFFGSGAVLFNKPRSHIETVNDLDGNVVNLFEWIRRDPERLAREIYYTPYARQMYEDAFDAVPEDSLRRAVNFFIRLNIGHGFRTNGERVGWKNDVQGRERAYAAQDWAHSERLGRGTDGFIGHRDGEV
ncbi:MAG: DNA adenine methylase [Lachnospiraceae bacterium]|nr:DNA adenine methylase [Lachnospiraceae bacterium]